MQTFIRVREQLYSMWRDQNQRMTFCANHAMAHCIMINDMILAILIAFAAVAAFNLLSRIWEYFGVPG